MTLGSLDEDRDEMNRAKYPKFSEDDLLTRIMINLDCIHTRDILTGGVSIEL